MAVKSKKLKQVKNAVPMEKKAWHPHLGFFLVGALLGLIILVLGTVAVFELGNRGKIYPGVKVAGVAMGGKTPAQVRDYFETQNEPFAKLTFAFVSEEKTATISGKKLAVGYDGKLLGDQAYLIGRSGNLLTALYQKWAAARGEIDLSPAFKFDSQVLDNFLENLAKDLDIPAQEALFNFEAGRVTAFKPSADGRVLDRKKAQQDFLKFLSPPVSGTITLTLLPVKPKVKTEEVNNLGINELLGEGKSFFRGSIPGRVHNIALASSRLNGILIPPGEVFSFNESVGEVSAKTGYEQAYIIREKRTVLDDGGGVCQVSTTLFRAALDAGLPIVERQAHAYRVSYYEQGGFGPGIDATVYDPTVDLKIKNDTPAHILVQTVADTKNSALTFYLYGTADDRVATIGKPRLTDQTPPPADLYQDDPGLPKGQVKQVDFAAWGGKAAFDYKVVRNGEVLEDRTFHSNFTPWQAVYLKGTKE